MTTIIVVVSKYLIILFMLAYTFDCFNVFRYGSEESRKNIYSRQRIWMFCIQTLSFLALFLTQQDGKLIIFYLIQLVISGGLLLIFKFAYPSANKLVLNNMCMLLAVGFIILTRLSYAKAIRQFSIVIVGLAICMFIPFLFRRIKLFDKMAWIFSAFGIAALSMVLLFSKVVNGSKINVSIMGITFQPSEIVKISFVFAIAGLLYKSESIKQVIISAVIAGLHVVILVLSKDLGTAVLFFAVYFAVLFVATRKLLYYLFGLLAGGMASVVGYKIFSHVRVRVQAWRDPIASIDNAGYQVAQSLFAIGTGSWFGMGIGQGAPNTIPVVEQDFVFAAICEELGVLFGICLILICVSCFVMFMNIAMRFQNKFYKLLAVGIAVTYGFQVFLTIGGVTKFIPLTGVTLPLVSYGGSSVVVSLMIFFLIEGMYITVKDEQNAIKKQQDMLKKQPESGVKKQETLREGGPFYEAGK